VLSYFLIATIFSHSLLMHCSVIFRFIQYSVILLFCYNKLTHFTQAFCNLVSHFLLQCSAISRLLPRSSIPRWYSHQTFFIATVLIHFLNTTLLSHSSLIQCSVISRCYNVQSFYTATVISHSLCYSVDGSQLDQGRRTMWEMARLLARGTELRGIERGGGGGQEASRTLDSINWLTDESRW
jgi:hypothetical protein